MRSLVLIRVVTVTSCVEQLGGEQDVAIFQPRRLQLLENSLLLRPKFRQSGAFSATNFGTFLGKFYDKNIFQQANFTGQSPSQPCRPPITTLRSVNEYLVQNDGVFLQCRQTVSVQHYSRPQPSLCTAVATANKSIILHTSLSPS